MPTSEIDLASFVLRLVTVDATFTSFSLVLFAIFFKSDIKDILFYSQSRLYVFDLRETFLSKFFRRRGKNILESFSKKSIRNAIDNIFGMSLFWRLIFIALFTVFELILYALGMYILVGYLFLINVYFVLEIIFSSVHYLTFVDEDLVLVYQNVFNKGYVEFILMSDQKNASHNAIDKKRKDAWENQYIEKIDRIIRKINNSSYFIECKDSILDNENHIKTQDSNRLSKQM